MVGLGNVRVAGRLPDGKYHGKWSGYDVRFSACGIEYIADSMRGVRGLDIDCVVTITDGVMTVEVQNTPEGNGG